MAGIYGAGSFRNEKRRSRAAFQMLQNGYAAIFEVNAHAHKAPQTEVENIIAQVTGLDADDTLIRTIYACFEKVRNFINPNENVYEPQPDDERTPPEEVKHEHNKNDMMHRAPSIGLTYSINIVLPQSGNIDTYNMIFKSLRENILDWEK